MSQSLRVKLLSLPVCAGLVSLLILCVSCNQAAEESSPEEIADYIEAFSAGTVRATDSIIIEFKDGIISDGEPPKDMMRFSPKLKGEERWDVASGRLEFIPEKGPLKAGDHYTCTVRLGKVIDGAKDFVFSFQVAERSAELEITETRISAEDPKTAIARGTLTLSEAVGDGVVTEGLFKTSTSWKTPVTLTRSAAATDDPDRSLEKIYTLVKGEKVTALAFLDAQRQWVLCEYGMWDGINFAMARGFLPADSLMLQ